MPDSRTRAERARAYVGDLTPASLLAKLRTEGIDHPGALAQALGQSGRGSAREVADRIVKHCARKRPAA
jgi:hypothetical protein